MEMEFDLQRKVLWMTGINYLIEAGMEEVAALYPSWHIAATRGDVRKEGLFARVEFAGKQYTALSGNAENTRGDLLRGKIDTFAGKDTRRGLNKVMRKAFDKFGGMRVELISRNEMTYRIV